MVEGKSVMEPEKQCSWQERESETWFHEETHSKLIEVGEGLERKNVPECSFSRKNAYNSEI